MYSARFLGLVAAAALVTSAANPAHAAKQFFYRVLGADSNAPITPKTRSAAAQDGSQTSASTGMADSGFTEYPVTHPGVNFTFVEAWANFPRIGSSAPIDTNRVTTADMVADHVYQPDGCVWGLTGREFVQTFVATGRELVSATLLVASEPGVFRVALHEGGPGGPQIGPALSCWAGSSMEWGSVRWSAGVAPTEPGRSYALRFWREDGKRWSPYLHSTGDCYDAGHVVVDGRPRPESDLAAWIVEEPRELTRAVVEGVDAAGWVRDSEGVVFVPRSPNIRLISVRVSPMTPDLFDMVLRVQTADGDREMLVQPKATLSAGPDNGPHAGHFLFGADDLPVVPGTRYMLDVYTAEHHGEAPDPAGVPVVARDYRVWIYGEPQPGAMPTLINVTPEFADDGALELSWATSFPCPAEIEIGPAGTAERAWVEIGKGLTTARFADLDPGADYDFRITITGPTGLTWRTPVYRVRVPATSSGDPGTPPDQDYPSVFVPLAPPTWASAPATGPIRYRNRVEVENGGFEQGLTGWKNSAPDLCSSASAAHGIEPPAGERMAGWTLIGREPFEQVFAENEISQRIVTVPGHRYLLAARVHTSVEGGPRGDTRVRLFADPAGGREFADGNSSQWYWTDGRWMRFEHRWTAEADMSTIGIGFFRWRDLARTSAWVDEIVVYDLGPNAPAPVDPPAVRRPLEEVPAVAVGPDRMESDAAAGFRLAAPPGHAITGSGVSADADGIAAVHFQVRPIGGDGTLGEREYVSGGPRPDAGIDHEVALPDGYAATGIALPADADGARGVALWARPLLADGTLGDEKIFPADTDPAAVADRAARVPAGDRLLTGIAWNGDTGAAVPRSARFAQSATARGTR